MARWDFAIALDPAARKPLFAQIAGAIADAVRSGRLRPGDRLPGSRGLARSLGVHRNTVLAALDELAAEGWTESVAARGVFVSRALPDPALRRPAGRARSGPATARAGFDLLPVPARVDLAPPVDLLLVSGGAPDVRLVPTAAIARAYRSAMRLTPELLAYRGPEGHPRLRAALAMMLSATRGMTATADDLLITRGSQMGLDLVARTLLRPGDVVAIEALGYRPAWVALAHSGAELVPIPVDGEGLCVDALAELAARRPVRALYLTPHHQYPTTVTLSAGRRLALLELARRHRIAVVEDDYDHEFHYDGRPVVPLAASDDAGVVIYLGTLSKILAPGLRLGYMVAPRPFLDQAATHRTYVDRQGDQVLELAIAELLEDGEVQRHARRMRRIYQGRRDCLASALRDRLAGAARFTVPPGGMAMWVGIDAEVNRFARRCEKRGVCIYTARQLAFDGRVRPYVRLGFAAHDEAELKTAVARMAAAL